MNRLSESYIINLHTKNIFIRLTNPNLKDFAII